MLLAKANDITFLGINYKSKSNNSILANDKVREAIFYAINKENIVQSSTSGLGTVAYEYMVPEYVATSPKASDGEFATFDQMRKMSLNAYWMKDLQKMR